MFCLLKMCIVNKYVNFLYILLASVKLSGFKALQSLINYLKIHSRIVNKNTFTFESNPGPHSKRLIKRFEFQEV